MGLQKHQQEKAEISEDELRIALQEEIAQGLVEVERKDGKIITEQPRESRRLPQAFSIIEDYKFSCIRHCNL